MLLTRNSPPPIPFPFQTRALSGIRRRNLVVVVGEREGGCASHSLGVLTTSENNQEANYRFFPGELKPGFQDRMPS